MKIVATFGWRWEPEWLVDGLRENLSWVDDFALIDDRDRTGDWGHEGEYRQRQIAKCRELGADWVLITSPDERWTNDTERRVRSLMERRPTEKAAYVVRFYNMWTRDQYRVDGMWGRFRRARLFPLHDDARFANLPIHNPSWPIGYPKVSTQISFYHFKTATAESRAKRAEMFQALDDKYGRQRRGYSWSYLTNPHGADIRRVPDSGPKSYEPKMSKDWDFDPDRSEPGG